MVLGELVDPDRNPDRPRAMAWEEYQPLVQASWEAALAGPDEGPLQDCLAAHPCLLPVYKPGDVDIGGHHGPWMDAVITQPPLAGFRKRVPDFMWFERTSATVTAVCVELERPTKFWFNRGGTPTANLTQALDQIQEWKNWFAGRPAKEFFDAYRLPNEWLFRRHFDQRYILLYGRRE
jgi:hypothetical protein